MTEYSLNLEVRPWDSIEQVKSKIKDQDDSLKGIYRLFYEGEELHDDKLLLDYNITDANMIHIDVQPESKNLNVKLISGKCRFVVLGVSEKKYVVGDHQYFKNGNS